MKKADIPTEKTGLNDRFTFLCDQSDLDNLDLLARKMRRSRSDVVRILIQDAYEELKKKEK